MTIQLTPEGLRGIFPRAPQAIIDNLVAGQALFDAAGITKSRIHLSYCFANVDHECSGFTIPNLTESTAYSRERAKQVWPTRKAQIDGLNGTAVAFQKALMNAMYGGRMGNRPGTDDGWRYIGRGGCQHTGRDGYAEMQKRTGIPLVEHPELAAKPEHQAALIAAFWSWKNLTRFADAKDFAGLVKAWNGGQIGMADRLAKLAENDPYIKRLNNSMTVIQKTITTMAPAPEPAKPVTVPTPPYVGREEQPVQKMHELPGQIERVRTGPITAAVIVISGIGAVALGGLQWAWHQVQTFFSWIFGG